MTGLAERIYDTIIANCMECGGEWMVSEKDAIKIIADELRKEPIAPCVNDCEMGENYCRFNNCDKYRTWEKEIRVWRILND